MTDGPGPVEAPRSTETMASPLRTRFERLIAAARSVLWWERLWPALWWPLAVVLLFVAVSCLGLWLDLSPLGRKIGLGLFALAFATAFLPLAKLRAPGRTAALDRLDREAGLSHGPARALDDTLALGEDDPGSRVLWDLHRRRAEAAVAKLRLPAPHPDMAQRDRFALRGMVLVGLAASVVVAGPEFGSRLGSAFDWRTPTGAAGAPSLSRAAATAGIEARHAFAIEPLVRSGSRCTSNSSTAMRRI